MVTKRLFSATTPLGASNATLNPAMAKLRGMRAIPNQVVAVATSSSGVLMWSIDNGDQVLVGSTRPDTASLSRQDRGVQFNQSSSLRIQGALIEDVSAAAPLPFRASYFASSKIGPRDVSFRRQFGHRFASGHWAESLASRIFDLLHCEILQLVRVGGLLSLQNHCADSVPPCAPDRTRKSILRGTSSLAQKFKA